MVVKNRNKCCSPHAAALRWCCLMATFFCLEQLANASRMLENLLLHENARLPGSPDQARDGYLEWNNGIRSTLDQPAETEEVETPLANRHWKLRGRPHLTVAEATHQLQQQQSSPLYEKQVPILSRRSLSAALQHSHQSGEKAHSPAYDLEEPSPPPYGSSSTQETTVSMSVRIPADTNELMSMDYTPVHRKPPINNEIPYFPAHYKPNELIPSGN